MRSFCNVAWLVALLLGVCRRPLAQSKDIARFHVNLRDVGKAPRRDTAYVDTLNRLAHAYYGNNADSAFFYGHKALEYAGRTGDRRGEAVSWRMLGNTYEMVGSYLDMLSAYQHSLDIAEELGDPTLIAKVNVNMALFLKQEGEYGQAQKLMEKVAALYKHSGDSVESAYVASHLADLALRQGRYDQALAYAEQAYGIARAVHDDQAAASNNNDIGRILAAKGDYAGALRHHLQSLTYYSEVRDRLGATATWSLLAQAYLLEKDYPRALRYAQASMTEAGALHRIPELQGSARVLADIYSAKRDYRQALHYFKIYKDYSDSLFNDESRIQLLTRTAQYDYTQQASALREAQAIKNAGYERALRRAQLQIAITVSVIAVLSLLAFILWRGRVVNRRMNRLLQEKNAMIEEQKDTLEQQAVQLLLNNQQKDKLFSVVAHDLRGPLNSLKGVLDFLKDKKVSEQEVSGMMSEFRRYVDASSELVGNLLYWASSQLNGAVVNAALLPVEELVDETLAFYRQQAREKGVLLTTAMPDGLVGYADKDMMQVVIRNLVSNAIKFCQAGDRVTVSAMQKGGEIEICVTDTGTGMTTDALDRIRRKESFTSYGTAREKGTGLGILLCHEFAEANRGRFYVESEWGKGSRCYFTIPAAPNSSSMRV
ncbi:MAG TPA: tetratricopeptide repeat-containing sensor histidine kinase [Puia sp.]|nr:tetratricopeptide repeat-containing sensor histidine kinase [Puia sp.]